MLTKYSLSRQLRIRLKRDRSEENSRLLNDLEGLIQKASEELLRNGSIEGAEMIRVTNTIFNYDMMGRVYSGDSRVCSIRVVRRAAWKLTEDIYIFPELKRLAIRGYADIFRAVKTNAFCNPRLFISPQDLLEKLREITM